MNPKQNLIIIKGKDRTDQISRIAQAADRMAVTFKGGKSYFYARDNVAWLTNPRRIPTENCRVSVDGDLLFDIVEILHFDTWVKVFSRSGYSQCCLFSELSVQPMKSSNGRNPDVFAYFQELAETSPLRTNDDQSLIAMKYRHLNIVSGRSILSCFLQARLLDSGKISPDLIFPFGCNMSQKIAVKRAIEHPVSLVQGPPGTGKTQTILNLIGNMLLLKKRVAVVSNNNSATANVLEKLKRYELDFMAASLGSAENKKAFIEGQRAEAILMPTLQKDQEASVRKEIILLNKELDNAFEKKNELAAIIQQIDALRLEMAHFEKYYTETQSRDLTVTDPTFQAKLSAKKLLKAWLVSEQEMKRLLKKCNSSLASHKRFERAYRFFGKDRLSAPVWYGRERLFQDKHRGTHSPVAKGLLHTQAGRYGKQAKNA